LETDQHLDIGYAVGGKIKANQIYAPPFVVTKHFTEDSLRRPLCYKVALTPTSFSITNEQDKQYGTSLNQKDGSFAGFPFCMQLLDYKFKSS